MTRSSAVFPPPVSCSKHRVCRIVTAAVLAGALSFAGEASADQTAAEPEVPRAPRVLIAAGGALGEGLNQFGLVARIEAGYRVVESALLGGFVEAPIVNADLEQGGDERPVERARRYVVAGARFELEPWPTAVLAPWLGAEFGIAALFGENVKPVVPTLGANIGFDFRPSVDFGVGPYAGVTVPLVDASTLGPDASPPWNPVTPYLAEFGLRFAMRFDAGTE